MLGRCGEIAYLDGVDGEGAACKTAGEYPEHVMAVQVRRVPAVGVICAAHAAASAIDQRIEPRELETWRACAPDHRPIDDE